MRGDDRRVPRRQVSFRLGQLEAIDRWRPGQPDVPSRPEASRRPNASAETSKEFDAMTSISPTISLRATSIARGLMRTERAAGIIKLHQRMLRLECHGGGFYWISPDGGRLLRGAALWEAEELQPKFIDAMERAGAIRR